ncbi:nucleoid-associated protein [Enterococcus casseliflavus]|uniref:37-kD nucleoid-associated bacterial protein n=1 Tax=Enterococcus casseliflavus TaxID=37734 RepID=A0ABD6Z0X4_ENTCA|nr:nucleoid-associated protein [Enterococcus casseliflavus]EOH79276.1 hypothetical protein UAM_02801 [Enterococcus casseliflavus ATCC 49996]EOU08917.1 hypothetical protein I582_02080 [Enterococcus casseliflavus ATCC 49996]MDT2975046.1 nucleoid-associated protein [Enterococcus casseliflavus]QGN29949.1 hypothetical protein GFU50_10685 [Enterococcus casseliflavus]QQB85340.1 nucleoid-associated protein [Enterococcus casseliflavus]
MINYLKVFEIDPELEVISRESEVMRGFESKIDVFFKKHIIKSTKDVNSKAARFRSDNSDIFIPCSKCFIEDDFEQAALKIADHLKMNMHYSVKKSFLLIVFTYKFTDDEFIGNDELLAIMKMELNEGIQMNGNVFKIQPNMLPDLGNSLQKCAFIYKSKIDSFEDNSVGNNFHLRILDKQDKTISTYFINLMNSVLVADDQVMSRLAHRFIRRKAKDFVENQVELEAVDKQLNIIMSQRKRTSINAIVTEIYPLLNNDLLEKASMDEDTLAKETFNLILQSNPSAAATFTSQPTNGEKYRLSSENRSIWVSIEQGLVDDNTVKIDELTDNRYVRIDIPKAMVNHG